MRTKDDVAQKLAAIHYDVDEDITQIYRLLADREVESAPDEPIKLLEVNKDTIAAGILPLGFNAIPRRGITYPYVIVQVTPDEFRKLKSRQLKLPKGWRLGGPLQRPGGNGEQ